MARVAPMLHYAHATVVGRRHRRRRHRPAGGDHRLRPGRHQEGPGLLDHLAARLHVPGGRRRGLRRRLFHMLTHAFFKALLFLSAGAVIHALARPAGHEGDGGPAQVPPPHLRRLRRRLARHLGHTAAGRLLVQGRRPGVGLADEQSPVGRRRAHGRPHRLLHEPPVRPRVHRAGPLGGTAAPPRPAVPGEAENHEATAATGRTQRPARAGLPAPAHAEAAPQDPPWVMSAPLVVLAIAAVLGGGINFPAWHMDFLSQFLRPMFPRRRHWWR